jgi:hypothetical protein
MPTFIAKCVMSGEGTPHKQRSRPSLTVFILSRWERNKILLTCDASATLLLGVKQFPNHAVGRAEGLSLPDTALDPNITGGSFETGTLLPHSEQ